MKVTLNKTQRVPVMQILRMLTASVDSVDVHEMDGVGDSWVNRKVDNALARLIITGETGFDAPIVVQRVNTGWRLGNGHHRLFAAILMMHETIDVFFDDGNDWMRTSISTKNADFADGRQILEATAFLEVALKVPGRA